MAVNKPPRHSANSATSLQDRARRLANPVRVLASGFRRLRGDTTETLLSALLIEIDETILPRRIRLETDTNHALDLIVTDRRLMRVSTPDGQETTGSTDALITKLNIALEGAAKAATRSTRIDVICTHSDPGSSARALAATASLELVPPPDPDPVPGLFDALSGQMSAWITVNPAGNCLKRGGQADWINRLDLLVRDGLENIDTQMLQTQSDPDQPGCMILGAAGADGHILLYARSTACGFLALLPGDRLSDIQSVWNTSLT